MKKRGFLGGFSERNYQFMILSIKTIQTLRFIFKLNCEVWFWPWLRLFEPMMEELFVLGN
ncbi:hypothetical protein BCV39_03045 [Vibrio sp. 10N.286.55.E10]|nr:hypothetical protein BCV39_03045 [Vibrio sp. 10N.286.55.E10]PME44294.1 hypothetical protein BCV40_00490 [Vibrio sp. 10N.286.55.E12]PME63948.1 hypothetical protein BCV32_03950 [Vibrio sp. 10N.286.55.C11]PMI20633.1 hypothetical protein BCU50_17155 [Vibrio sp. 10N.286.46.E10]PMJ00196.1 hypothetical protein BCU34_14320 [Vibrio sp. 10N.286.45.E10]PTO97101.1 hypothetical protein CWO08_05085 [Vibrio sp. 10N.286.48.B8]PTP06465.1 hypothetical protein CWO17_09645 [Vibrio sp. 10N.286.45.A3]PTP15189.